MESLVIFFSQVVVLSRSIINLVENSNRSINDLFSFGIKKSEFLLKIFLFVFTYQVCVGMEKRDGLPIPNC